MQLRDYQAQMSQDFQTHWDLGFKVLMGVLPTGGGKSVILANEANKVDGGVALIAHRQELVSQLSFALARCGIQHGIVAAAGTISTIVRLHVEEFGRSFYSPNSLHRVCSIDTLIRMPPTDPWLARVKLWITDECFPAGTLVDGVPIETLRVGDSVTAFNEATGEFSLRKITHIFKNEMPENMVSVVVGGSHVLQCTSGHPFWTRRGWVSAIDLRSDDYVLLHELQKGILRNGRGSEIPFQENREDILQQNLRVDLSVGLRGSKEKSRAEKGGQGTIYLDLQRVQETISDHGRLENKLQQKGKEIILLESVLDRIPSQSFIGNDDTNEQNAPAGSDAEKRSHEFSRGAGKDVGDHESSGTPAESARRKWEAANGSRSDAGENAVRLGLQRAMHCPHGNGAVQRGPATDTLQNRLREPRFEDSYRSGRKVTPHDGSTRTGCKEGQVSSWTRVDRIEIFKREDSQRMGFDFPADYVYNIEVDELHTYVANGVVVHNCHHLVKGNKWEKGINMFPRSARGLGVTATPCRADGKGLGRHADGLIDVMIEGPRMRELIDRGFLTDYMIWCPPSDIDLSGVGIAPSGDYSPEGVRKAVHQSKQIVGDVVQHYLKVAPGLRGVTFCVDIESATEICEEYRHYGVPAEVLTGKTPDLVRAQILRKLRDGSILQVTSVDVLSEGFDLPAIEAISFARPTESYGLFAQQFGRALRTLPGKTHARIIDHVGNVIRHRPPDAYREWSLDRRERRSKSAPSDVIPMRACPQCTRPYERHLVGCPYCGFFPEPAGRGTPEQVEGDLALLTPEVLAKMRGDLARVDAGVVNVPYGADPAVAGRLHRIARERNEALTALRCSMDQYGGIMAAKGASPRETSRAFYQQFGIDVISAQLLNANDSNALRERIERTWK